jgi:drug/metabolite transporter (DMT)-like permease
MTPPRPLIGVAYMLAAMVVLPCIDVIAKFLGQEGLPILILVWARLTFGTVLVLPFALRHARGAALLPDRPLMHLLRATLLGASTFAFFYSLKTLPIADALAIFFVQPLVITALSPLVLGETVGPRRWIAVAIGFVGTLIIIRPGMAPFVPGTVFALSAGTTLALYLLMTRRISGSAPAMLTTFHTNLMGALLTSVLVPFVWQAPEPRQWLLLIALAAIANLGHYFIVRAYDYAEASLLAPLGYTEMVTSTLLGWLFFRNFPDGYTLVGVAILIACAIYISTSRAAQRGDA